MLNRDRILVQGKYPLAVHLYKKHASISLVLLESPVAWQEGLLQPSHFCQVPTRRELDNYPKFKLNISVRFAECESA